MASLCSPLPWKYEYVEVEDSTNYHIIKDCDGKTVLFIYEGDANQNDLKFMVDCVNDMSIAWQMQRQEGAK
jgi:hypothetical protein